MPSQGEQAARPANPKVKHGDDLKGCTDAVADFIATDQRAAFPPDVLREAKRCLIDGFAVILAGSTLRGSAIVREYVSGFEGKEASVVGPEPLRVAAAKAALANGASGHAMDYDDTQLSTTPDRTFGLLTHPTIPALAAALAVAERKNASGAQFLDAFVTGFEVECKIAEAIDPDHYQRGFHSSGTIGAFGAAASAARLLGLNRANIANMLAITASLSSGIRVNFGSMTKPLHVGRAAENGVFAAELASRGFTGGDAGLDGKWGFFQVFGGGAEPDRLIGALGRPYTIVNPGVSVKPYPCGSLSHPSMDAMLKLIVEHDLKPEQIKAVRLRAGSNILEPLRYKTAKTELEAKFCIPFLLSALILRRKAGIREFTDEFVSSAPVQEMMLKVTGVFDREIEAQGFDKMRSIVEVDLVDGRALVERADERYRGGPEKPFTREELHEKFTDCASLLLSPERIRTALTQIESVEMLKSIRELIATLSSSAGRKTNTPR
ncbi:MAG TPA: MmgE/PrpD family protein [Vicinamibacterales bacterium]|nr:MmgE/PrpD family protein [Vicinamibacterales bacterium]